MLFFAATLGATAQHRDVPRMLWVARQFAPVYTGADYLASVVDTVWRGDSVTAFERKGRFVRVEALGIAGWMLDANLTRTRPDGRGRAASAGGAGGVGRSAGEPRAEDAKARSARCEATIRTGAQCSRSASTGSRFCWQHGGSRR